MDIKNFCRCSFFIFVVGLRNYQHTCSYMMLSLLSVVGVVHHNQTFGAFYLILT